MFSRMPRLSLNDDKELIKLRNDGLSNREIGRRLKCDEKSVRITGQKHQKTGTVRYALNPAGLGTEKSAP